jgi:hypothetical protein
MYTNFWVDYDQFCIIGICQQSKVRAYLSIFLGLLSVIFSFIGVLRLDFPPPFFFVGWDWVHLVRQPLIGLLHQRGMIDGDECGAVGGMTIGRGNRSTWRKPAPAPLCPPQIPHDWLELKPGLPGWEAGNQPSELWHGREARCWTWTPLIGS